MLGSRLSDLARPALDHLHDWWNGVETIEGAVQYVDPGPIVRPPKLIEVTQSRLANLPGPLLEAGIVDLRAQLLLEEQEALAMQFGLGKTGQRADLSRDIGGHSSSTEAPAKDLPTSNAAAGEPIWNRHKQFLIELGFVPTKDAIPPENNACVAALELLWGGGHIFPELLDVYWDRQLPKFSGPTMIVGDPLAGYARKIWRRCPSAEIINADWRDPLLRQAQNSVFQEEGSRIENFIPIHFAYFDPQAAPQPQSVTNILSLNLLFSRDDRYVIICDLAQRLKSQGAIYLLELCAVSSQHLTLQTGAGMLSPWPGAVLESEMQRAGFIKDGWIQKTSELSQVVMQASHRAQINIKNHLYSENLDEHGHQVITQLSKEISRWTEITALLRAEKLEARFYRFHKP